MKETADWVIVSEDDPTFRVELADCTREHAESVLQGLVTDLARFPRGLVLEGRGRRSLYKWRRG